MEESERIAKRIQKIKEDGGNVNFWKERRVMKKEYGSDWLITRDDSGKRIFDPDLNKENMATYYESLYKKKPTKEHPYHDDVEKTIKELACNNESGLPENDSLPSQLEIKEAITNKKNNKATTDWKNEILKRGGDEMVTFVQPVVDAFWNEEETPDHWNMGVITSVWKGRGNREQLKNHRGITVSSSIGTIAEEIVFNRVSRLIKFSPAQAGGRKGGSTADQVFILKGVISLAKKEKRNIIITFFDVVKAYDRADMDDMLYSMYKSGIHGKLWRLVKSLNEGLNAKINTKAGLTRSIERETGGKQGGKLMVSLFAKMMDNMAENMTEDDTLGVNISDTIIPSLLYVDDAITFAEGYEQQQRTLDMVYEFALKHKLEWGADKCRTMEIGTHAEKRSEWKLGEMTITKCSTYKYLGEQISRDGKNDTNLKSRIENLKISVRAIITCCRSEVMKRIGVKVMLMLHESETMTAFLYNAETWSLNKTEKVAIDKAEVYALKKMIGLPTTTPTAGIIFTLGCLYTSVRIEIKQFMYLHRILNKENGNWVKTILYSLQERNIGWAKQMIDLLESWQLPQDWAEIASMPLPIWKNHVKIAAEKQNIKRLNNDCESKLRGETKLKTKTTFVSESLQNPAYQRKLDSFLTQFQSILYTRALIMGRYGMLQCANNFSNGYGGKLCKKCDEIDDEAHRINSCITWRSINLYDKEEKILFSDIFSEENEKCYEIVKIILSMWDLENGKNEMRQC